MPRVNPEIWEKLSPNTRSADIKLQRVQNASVQAMIAITHTTDTLVAATKSWENFSKEKIMTTITMLVDGVALMANATQELNQWRHESAEARGAADGSECRIQRFVQQRYRHVALPVRIRSPRQDQRDQRDQPSREQACCGPDVWSAPLDPAWLRPATTAVPSVGQAELDGALLWCFFRPGLPSHSTWKAIPTTGASCTSDSSSQPT